MKDKDILLLLLHSELHLLHSELDSELDSELHSELHSPQFQKRM
jgi:hypothetical protein